MRTRRCRRIWMRMLRHRMRMKSRRKRKKKKKMKRRAEWHSRLRTRVGGARRVGIVVGSMVMAVEAVVRS